MVNNGANTKVMPTLSNKGAKAFNRSTDKDGQELVAVLRTMLSQTRCPA